MAEINSALLTVHYTGDHRTKLEGALSGAELIWVDRNDSEGIEKALEFVDVAILASDLDARFMGSKQLQWVHYDHAGLEKSAMPALFETSLHVTSLHVTSSAGRSALALADHAIFFMLALAYEFPRFLSTHSAHTSGESRIRTVCAGYTDERSVFWAWVTMARRSPRAPKQWVCAYLPMTFASLAKT